MADRKAQTEALVLLTEIAWARAAQALAEKTAAERAAAGRIARLRAAIDRSEASVRESGDMAMRQALDRWRTLADAQATALNMALARSRAASARERQAAATALARREAAKRLLDRETAELRRRRERRETEP